MKRFFLLMVGMISVIAPAFGSEKIEEIVRFSLKFDNEYQPIYYSDKKYIGFLNETYNMGCQRSEPFVQLDRAWVPIRKMSPEEQLVKKITLWPLKYFINGDVIEGEGENNTFKKQGDILFSFSQVINDQKKQFQFISNMDFHISLKELLQRFKRSPKCMQGHIVGEEGKMLVCVDTTELEKELCADHVYEGVQYDRHGECVHRHGPKSFFAGKEKTILTKQKTMRPREKITQFLKEAVKKEEKAQKEEEQRQTTSFYKKLFGGSLVVAAVLLAYGLLQKYYATA